MERENEIERKEIRVSYNNTCNPVEIKVQERDLVVERRNEAR